MPKNKAYELQTLLPLTQNNNNHMNHNGNGHLKSNNRRNGGNVLLATTSITTSSDDDDEAVAAMTDKQLEQQQPRRQRYVTSRKRYGLWNKRRCGICCPQILRRFGSFLLCALLFLFLFYFLLIMYSDDRMRRAPLPDWSANVSRNIADYVLLDNDTTLLEPRNLCRDKMFLLIVVCSSVENFAARQNIRESWGNSTQFNYNMFATLHSHLQGQYLEPLPERLQYYRDYLKVKHNQSDINLGGASPSTTVPQIPVRVVFLIGHRKDESLLSNETLQRIQHEAAQYDDIVQENFIDSYNNLTIKSVMALKWVTRRCLQSTAFVMKCDDDTFVNVPNLLHYLLGGTVPLYNDTLDMHTQRTSQVLRKYNRLNATQQLLMGHLFCDVHPIADVGNKWYMPHYMFPNDTYPKYLSGASYIMTSDVVPRLYAAALNTTLIHMEDIYITGMCAQRIGLRRRHNPLFSFERARAPCAFKGSITQHYLKMDSMLEMYAFVSNVSIQCAPPTKYLNVLSLRKSASCT